MTNPIAKAVHCSTCGAPKGVACIALNPGAKKQIVATHAARKALYQIYIRWLAYRGPYSDPPAKFRAKG